MEITIEDGYIRELLWKKGFDSTPENIAIVKAEIELWESETVRTIINNAMTGVKDNLKSS